MGRFAQVTAVTNCTNQPLARKFAHTMLDRGPASQPASHISYNPSRNTSPLLLFFLLLFSCYFFSYFPTVTFFPVTFFPVTFFPVTFFPLLFFLLLSFLQSGDKDIRLWLFRP